MLKYFCGTAALYVVLTPLMTEVASSRSLFVSQQPEVLNPEVQSNVDVPLCYIQTADGRIVDLQQLCSNNDRNSPVGTSSSGGLSRNRGLRFRAGGYAGDNTGGEDDTTRSD